MALFCKIQRGNPVHYLRIYINFCYYAALLPFTIIFDSEIGTYKLKTSRVQKAFTILLSILVLCEEIISFRGSLEGIRNPPQNNRMDPIIYFEMFSVASNFVYYVTVVQTIWFKSHRFLKVFQHLHEAEEQFTLRNQRGDTNVKAQIWFGISLLPFLFYPASFFGGFFLRNSTLNFNKCLMLWGEGTSQVFLVESYFPNFPYAVQVFLAILRNIFLLAYTQMTTAMEILGITAAITMNDSVQDFSSIVINAEKYSSHEILNQYKLLRSLSRKLNRAIGTLTFGLTLACLPYYVANLLEFINPSNVAVFFRHLIFFINSFGFLFLAAQINKKARMLEERLLTEKDFSDMSPNQLSIFLHDLGSHNIGFNGSGFFMISPGFVGTIISLLLTFSIIIIQFQNNFENGSMNSKVVVPVVTR